MAMRLFTERTGAMMVAMGSGDDSDALAVRARRHIDTRAVTRLTKADNENLEEHDREGGGKIAYTTIHHDCVTRLEDERVLRILGAMRGKLAHTVWLVFLALYFGTVEDERGILRFHPATQEYKERLPTLDEVARHYRLTVRTVQEYDRRARAMYELIEPAVDLLPGERLEIRRKLGWIGPGVMARQGRGMG
jgi:hypothetical protein